MGIIDFVLIAAVIISGLLASYRGLIRELLGLTAWILAAFGAFYGYPVVSPLFQKFISNPKVADIVAAIVIALIILIICTIINAKITSKLRKSVLSGLDRTLGFAFGVLRGLLLAFIIYYFAEFSMQNKVEEYTEKNISLAYLKKTMPLVENILPDEVIDGIQNMSQKQQGTTTGTVEIKEKPPVKENSTATAKKEILGVQKEEVPYNKKDLDSMDILLESLEEE